MSSPKFSIIIPAWNAENHIRRGLDSIAAQSFKDYELIVVCDSCTDQTEQIARSYGAVTDNVHFGKDGLTRDRGIELATGEWILFMDDDDWFLHEYVFQQLSEVVGEKDEDVLDFAYIWKDRGYIRPSMQAIFTPRISHVWSKAWRRSTVGDARFGDATFCSDTWFLKATSTRVRRAVIWDMPMYYYNFMRPGSQTDLFVKGIIRQSPVAE